MINLLPPKEKQELLFQKNRNFVVVLGSILVVFLVYLSLMLISLKFYILQKISYEKSILQEIEQKYKNDDFLLSLNSIEKYNMFMSKADSFYKKEVYLSKTLKSIVEVQRPKGVIFNSINMEKSKMDDKIKAIISGTSSNREGLVTFKNNIENQKGIKSVYLPPDNLVKPTNINFSLTIETDFTK